MSRLADALFSRTRQRVLAILFGRPRESFHTQEIIRQARVGTGAVQRELARLEQSGLVKSTMLGRQRHYQANPKSPLFNELTSIVNKTIGIAEPLREALQELKGIRAAFVYGSVAQGRDRASSDVDLMVIGDDVTYADVFDAVERVAIAVGRSIQPTVYTTKDYEKRRRDRNNFMTKVIAGPKIWVIGGASDLSL